MTDAAKKVFLSMNEREKEALADNIIDTLFFADDEVRLKIAVLLTEVDEELGSVIKKCMIF